MVLEQFLTEKSQPKNRKYYGENAKDSWNMLHPQSACFLIGYIPFRRHTSWSCDSGVVGFPHIQKDFWLQMLNKFNTCLSR